MLSGTKDPLTKDDLFAEDGSLKALDICQSDPVTGLIIPNPRSEMLLANGHLMSMPSGEYFVHPETGL